MKQEKRNKVIFLLFIVILTNISILNGAKEKKKQIIFGKEPNSFETTIKREETSGSTKKENIIYMLKINDKVIKQDKVTTQKKLIASYKKKEAFEIVNTEKLTKKSIKQLFYIQKINDTIFQRIYGKSYKKDCTISKKDLRYVRVLHYGFDNKVHIGELIVNYEIAEDIVDIFYQLYLEKYPIERMILIDEYDADDTLSMEANNTSCFNFRKIAGSTKLSNHSQGRAIDINPLYNPYVKRKNGITICEPEKGFPYIDRKKKFSYKINKKDICYQLFIEHGFTWGGNWSTVKDYQHFEKSK